jgi:hypothetical protein
VTQKAETKNVAELCKGIMQFMRGFQPGTNLVEAENSKTRADSRSILNRGKNH